jgi:PQQ-dependent dehydrogenase (methanol/ethanol family)
MTRRLKLVAGVFAAAAVTCIGGLVAAQVRADTPTNPFINDRAAAAAGAATFASSCAACHGPGATGTERAPALNTGRLKTGDDDYDIFQTIHNGVPGTQMPPFKALPAEDIWRLVTYIKSLSGGSVTAASASAASAKGDAAAGERLFFGKGQCATCHEVNGAGSILGPDLSGAGTLAELGTRMLHKGPRSPFAPPFQLSDVTLTDGKRVSGVVRKRDSYVVHVQQRDGTYALYDKDQVAQVTPVAGSGPPTDLETRLSATERENLLAYLSGQRGRDFAKAVKAPLTGGLAYERIAKAESDPNNWLTYWGDYRGRHFSELSQITAQNVGGLQARWVAPLPGEVPVQATPLVVDGVMYVSGPPGDVYAIDARSGAQLWKFSRRQDKRNPYQINPSNRGVAVLGNRVFFNTLDNNLIALDARTGRQLWEKNLADTMHSYTMTGAPLVLKDKVIVGMSGGEAGVRGFLEAYDPATGQRLWRFETIPGPGQPGNETWAGDSWKTGGGATWLTGSYDAELDLLYWTVGNPGPDFDPTVRAGDNLHTNSVVAINPKTGKLVWSYQFTPNDSHDWDAVADLVLTDRMVEGKMRKVMLHADRNGFFYMLDRTNGQFLWARNFVQQTWNAGFDAKGKPQVRPESVATREGAWVMPAVGATNFQAPSYDEKQGIYYLAFQDAEAFIAFEPVTYEPGKLYWARSTAPRPPARREPVQGVMAMDVATGQRLWTFPFVRNSLSAGVLATRGGVVFASSGEGWLSGLDARTGKSLWRIYTGGPMSASPISYAVDGRQYVAVAAGNNLLSFALPQ